MPSKPHFPEELLESNHKFARDIYHILAKQKENVVFSPISLQAALLLALSGARGKTAEEIKTGLNLCKEKDEILQGARLLFENLTDPNLKIASQLFIGQQYKIENTYKSLVEQYLIGSYETVDFERSPEEAARRINSWISEKTENEISNIIDSGSLYEDTCLLLVNAVYFKDDWRYKFSTFLINDEPFYSTKDNFHKVPMMYRDHIDLKYLQEELYRVVELPYENEDFRFLILLPKEIDGLHKLEEKLVEIDFRKMFSNLRTRRVRLTLPKFKMEQMIDDVETVLQELGMKTLFDQKAADFTEIYSNPDVGVENLYVSNVCHKAIIEVNEQGTKAVGVTRVAICGGGGGGPPIEVFEFKVDHPFIFLILHRNTILFMGKKTTFV